MIAFIFTLLLGLNTSQVKLPVVLHFRHIENGLPLEKNKVFVLNEQQSCVVKQWKYYISHVELTESNGKSILVPGVFLIDAFGKDSINLQLPNGKYKELRFSIGIDSSIQLSGAQDGDLDPLNGMYWAWNTGYIHYKLEGERERTGKSSERFQYHIGGFAAENNTMQHIKIPFLKTVNIGIGNNILPVVTADVTAFLNNETLNNEKLLIMKEGKDAVKISTILPSVFSIKK